MSVKEIVFSMIATMVIVFAVFPFYRKREVKTNNLEVLYFDALNSQASNIDELGMNYYMNIGLSSEAAKKSIENDKAHTKA